MSQVNRQFHLRECVGRGGFGEVYRATMHTTGGLSTEVALKVLRVDTDLGGSALDRLKDEGRLLGLLRHPVILRAYDIARLEGRVALVTEFIEGMDLHQAIRDERYRLPVRAMVEVVGGIADALHVAWEADPIGAGPMRLVHRDIKPQNIRLGIHGEVKLLDFGVAFSSDVDRQARTMSNTVLGSLPYMAPERFTTARPGTASDIYALISCLYEAIQGERLQGSPTPVEMYARASSQEDHDLYLDRQFARLPSDLPTGVLELLRDGLRFDEAARPTARALAARCEELAATLPGPTLKGWARNLPPLESRALPTPWVGRMLVDGEDLPPSRSPSTLPPSLLDEDLQADALRPPAPAPAQTSPAPAEEDDTSGLPLWLLGGAVFVLTVLLGVTGLLLWGPVFGPSEPAAEEVATDAPAEDEFEEDAVVLWKVAGEVRGLELRNESDAYGPGWTPAGAYQLYADFGAGPKWVKNVELEEDTEPVFRCDRATRTCTVE